MSVLPIWAYKEDYERRKAQFTNHETISEYSVTIKREVIKNRSNARYLYDSNIRDGVHFDLAIGLKTFTDKSKMLNNEPCLVMLCKWATGQPGDTVKEVFGNADFASWRGTMKRIAMTLVRPNNKWTVVAQDFGGVILISELSKVYHNGNNGLATYSGFKFEQYMTADTPDGQPKTGDPVDNRATFEMMIRTQLVDRRASHTLCIGAEIDGLSESRETIPPSLHFARSLTGRVNERTFLDLYLTITKYLPDEPVEFKTAWEGNEDGFNRNMKTLLQNEMVGVNSIVVGIKTGDVKNGVVIVNKVIKKNLQEIRSNGDVGKSADQCYSFLSDVLTKIKKFLEHNEACEVSYAPLPTRKKVEFKSITKQEAKDSGNGVTDDFLKRFKLKNNVDQKEPSF